MAKGSNLTSSLSAGRERQDAPPRLEPVRLFLQTWSIPNDTRVPVDQISSLEDAKLFQARHLHQLAATAVSSRVRKKELATLRALRDDLRASLEADEARGLEILQPWVERLPVTAGLSPDGPDPSPVHYRYRGTQDALAGAVLAQVVEAVAAGIWRRLKVCPDCRSVFYDRTKNHNRVWCGMFAHGPGGRACGSIAKVQNWRKRQKSTDPQ